MARYVIPSASPARRNEDIVRKLASELAAPSSVQPAFIEQLLDATHSRHVYVIWDRWADLPDDERSDAILRAYTELEGEAALNIAFGIGLTSREAVESGLLPFVVQSTRKQSDSIPLKEYERVFTDEARETIPGPHSRQLRYPTLEAAEEAKGRLNAALPGSSWAITQEIHSSV